MSGDELSAYLEGLDGDKPEDKNYWDRGHWITGVEGRWHGGIPQYRISHEEVPPRRAYWWFWYLNLDQEAFSRHVHRLADEGFTLVHSNHFQRPDGSVRYQGVWHKLIPRLEGQPLPQGQFRLVEMSGEPYPGPPVVLRIEGERFSGKGPVNAFEGSCASRYTVQAVPLKTDGSLEALPLEAKLLEGFREARWEIRQDRLHLVRRGRTALQFEALEKTVEPLE